MAAIRFAEICMCFIKINAQKFCRARKNFGRALISIRRFTSNPTLYSYFALNLFAKRLLRSMFAVGETKPKDNMCSASFQPCFQWVVSPEMLLLHLGESAMATSERPNFRRINLVARSAAVHSLVNPFCVVCIWWNVHCLTFTMGAVIVSGDDVINRRLFTPTQLNPLSTWTIFARVLK